MFVWGYVVILKGAFSIPACIYAWCVFAMMSMFALLPVAVICQPLPADSQEPGAAPTPAPVKPPPKEDDALDDSKFDEFMGSDAGAFATFGEYDQVPHTFC